MMKSRFFLAAFTALALALSGCSYLQDTSAASQRKPVASKPFSDKSIEPPAPDAPSFSVVNTPVIGTTARLTQYDKPRLKAAILLPLSGENAALGQAMMNAAQQAVFDVGGPEFELQPYNTAAPGGADTVARLAVSNGARVIIGPVFASEIPSVRYAAQPNNLMVLPLSTDTSMADRGVYVMGLAPGPQVERVVSYAAAHNVKNFAALIPSSPYGTIVGNAFRNAVERHGGKIVAFEVFDPAAHDLQIRIKSIAAQRNIIDALFLPESENTLKSIADQLTAEGFSPTHTHILGTGLWDTPDLAKLSPLLVGAWYAAPDPALRRQFVKTYAEAYGQEPPRLATLAYDATALAAILAKRGGQFDEAALTNPNGFSGLDGIFRLMPSGEVQRGMAINEVMPSGPRVLDPSPTSFIPARR